MEVKLYETENPWKLAWLRGSQAERDETEDLYKKVRSVLNKLTPEKFYTLVQQVQILPVNNSEHLHGIVNLVFDQAIAKPMCSVVYAQMCKTLSIMRLVGSSEEGQPEKFCNLLLDRCRQEFEDPQADLKRDEHLEEIERCTDPEKKKELQLEFEEMERHLRMKSVAFIRFVGELFKLGMLTSNVLHRYMQCLLMRRDEVSLECLCELLIITVKHIETTEREKEKGKEKGEKEKHEREEEAEGEKNKELEVIAVPNKVNAKLLAAALEEEKADEIVENIAPEPVLPVLEQMYREDHCSSFDPDGQKKYEGDFLIKLGDTREAKRPEIRPDVLNRDLYKKVRSVLNKLTPEKFHTLLQQVQILPVDNSDHLHGIVNLVFDQAIAEPRYSVVYAQMCKTLSIMQLVGSSEEGEPEKFRKLLSERCRHEFEDPQADLKRDENLEEIERCTDPEKKKELQLEFEEMERQLRMKSVAFIRFVGELFKLGMLTSNVLHHYIQSLLMRRDEVSLECLCELLTITGKLIETTEHDLSKYFEEIKIFSEQLGQISTRVRFMLQGVIELRDREWVPRRHASVPKRLGEIRHEAMCEWPLGGESTSPSGVRGHMEQGSDRRKRGGRCGDGRQSLPRKNLDTSKPRTRVSDLTNVSPDGSEQFVAGGDLEVHRSSEFPQTSDTFAAVRDFEDEKNGIGTIRVGAPPVAQAAPPPAEKQPPPSTSPAPSSTPVTAVSPAPRRASPAPEIRPPVKDLYKKVRSVLNKLTPEKFLTLVQQVQILLVDNSEHLQGIVNLVFDKAIAEPMYLVVYAHMCKTLSDMLVVGSSEEGQSEKFCKLLLNRCRHEFEDPQADLKRDEHLDEIERCTDPEKKKELKLEFEEMERQLRMKSVAFSRFVGELFKLGMLPLNVLRRYIQRLLMRRDEVSLECLCELLTITGKLIETTEHDLSKYFEEIKILSKQCGQISSRVRFMLQGVIELRDREWVSRRHASVPKTLDEIRHEAMREWPFRGGSTSRGSVRWDVERDHDWRKRGGRSEDEWQSVLRKNYDTSKPRTKVSDLTNASPDGSEQFVTDGDSGADRNSEFPQMSDTFATVREFEDVKNGIGTISQLHGIWTHSSRMERVKASNTQSNFASTGNKQPSPSKPKRELKKNGVKKEDTDTDACSKAKSSPRKMRKLKKKGAEKEGTDTDAFSEAHRSAPVTTPSLAPAVENAAPVAVAAAPPPFPVTVTARVGTPPVEKAAPLPAEKQPPPSTSPAPSSTPARAVSPAPHPVSPAPEIRPSVKEKEKEKEKEKGEEEAEGEKEKEQKLVAARNEANAKVSASAPKEKKEDEIVENIPPKPVLPVPKQMYREVIEKEECWAQIVSNGTPSRSTSHEGSWARQTPGQSSSQSRDDPAAGAQPVASISYSISDRDTRENLPHLSPDQVAKKVQFILEEFVNNSNNNNNNNWLESAVLVPETFPPSNMGSFVTETINTSLERSAPVRSSFGKLMGHLMREGILTTEQFLEGFKEIAEVADYLAIHVPKLWLFLAEILVPMLSMEALSFSDFKTAATGLHKLLIEILRLLLKEKGPRWIRQRWDMAGISWEDFAPAHLIYRIVKENKLEFTVGPVDEMAQLTSEVIHTKLLQMLQPEQGAPATTDEVSEWISANVGDRAKMPEFIRILATAVCESAYQALRSKKFDEVSFSKHVMLLQKYIDTNEELELHCLYAVQELNHRLEQPSGLLCSLFQALWDYGCVTNETFLKWEQSRDPAFLQGKGIALESLTAFFSAVQDADDDSSEDRASGQ